MSTEHGDTAARRNLLAHVTGMHGVNIDYAATWTERELIEWHLAHDHERAAVKDSVRHAHPAAWAMKKPDPATLPQVGEDGQEATPYDRLSKTDSPGKDMVMKFALGTDDQGSTARHYREGTVARLNYETSMGHRIEGRDAFAVLDRMNGKTGATTRWQLLDGPHRGSYVLPGDVFDVRPQILFDAPENVDLDKLAPVLARKASMLASYLETITLTDVREPAQLADGIRQLMTNLVAAFSRDDNEPERIDEPMIVGTLIWDVNRLAFWQRYTPLAGPDRHPWINVKTGTTIRWDDIEDPQLVTRVYGDEAYVKQGDREIHLKTRLGQ